MYRASDKMDFNSLLATHLRSEMYNAAIVPSNIDNPDYSWGSGNPRYYPCVEVGFPKPALRFICVKEQCYWQYVEDKKNWPGGFASVSGSIKRTAKAQGVYLDWKALGPLHSPELLDKIMDIIYEYGKTLCT